MHTSTFIFCLALGKIALTAYAKRLEEEEYPACTYVREAKKNVSTAHYQSWREALTN